MKNENLLIPLERIGTLIFLIRGQRVILDHKLAYLYQVETKYLTRAVKRNIERFPDDFMFQLSKSEFDSLRCQIGTSNGRGGKRYLPYAFTEHGAIMLASVLNSTRAIHASIYVVRAFVKFRDLLFKNEEVKKKLNEIEEQIANHSQDIQTLFQAIRQLMKHPEKPKRKIGFQNEI